MKSPRKVLGRMGKSSGLLILGICTQYTWWKALVEQSQWRWSVRAEVSGNSLRWTRSRTVQELPRKDLILRRCNWSPESRATKRSEKRTEQQTLDLVIWWVQRWWLGKLSFQQGGHRNLVGMAVAIPGFYYLLIVLIPSWSRNTRFKESENVVAKSEHIFYPSCFAGKDADILKVIIRLITSDKGSDNSWLQS